MSLQLSIDITPIFLSQRLAKGKAEERDERFLLQDCNMNIYLFDAYSILNFLIIIQLMNNAIKTHIKNRIN